MVVGLFALAKVPVPLTTVHVPCTCGKGNRPASGVEKPQTLWSGPALAGVKGGVTWMEKPKLFTPVCGQASSTTFTEKRFCPMSAAVGVQQNVPTGRLPAVVEKVAPGIPLFQVMVTVWPASASPLFTLKQSCSPAQMVVV